MIRLEKWRPGLRNIKTAIAIILCIALYSYIEREGVVLAAIAALICMRDSVEKSIEEGQNRMIGTALGGLLGVLFLYIPFLKINYFLWLVMVFLGIVFLIQCFNLFKIRDSISIGCIVFLIIVIQAEEGAYFAPFIYALNRVLDTFIGIIIATGVNYFLFRPAPERIKSTNLKDLEYEIIPQDKQKEQDWSGGITTELFIYPPDAFYSNRDFEWRISSSKILSRASVFTVLPGYNRKMMTLEGRIALDHHNNHRIILEPFDKDVFSGEWVTKSYGYGMDFNLIVAEGYESELSAVSSENIENLSPDGFTSFYFLVDGIELVITSKDESIEIKDLQKHDFIMIYPFQELLEDPNLSYSFRFTEDKEVVAIKTVVFPMEEEIRDRE